MRPHGRRGAGPACDSSRTSDYAVPRVPPEPPRPATRGTARRLSFLSGGPLRTRPSWVGPEPNSEVERSSHFCRHRGCTIVDPGRRDRAEARAPSLRAFGKCCRRSCPQIQGRPTLVPGPGSGNQRLPPTRHAAGRFRILLAQAVISDVRPSGPRPPILRKPISPDTARRATSPR